MRIKLYCSAFLLMPFITYNVKGQNTVRTSHKENFISFTADKSYADINKLKAITTPAFYRHPDFGKPVNDKTDWYEQIDKRTLKSRTFVGANNEIIIESGYDNLNYTDANGWLRAVNTKLKPSADGWAATQQEIPTYLYNDASTALSLGGNDLMVFNKNTKFNYNNISIVNYTVGDNGMFIKNAVQGVDKIIRFGRGRIETDYTINQPLDLNGNLVISEDIALPDGYIITGNDNYNTNIDGPRALVVKNAEGKVVAELQTPFCYDSHCSSVYGSYYFQKQNGGYRLEVDVPSPWLNNPSRQYPVIIDPIVYGPTSLYSGGKIGSCVYPTFDTASIQIIVPGEITITNLFSGGELYAPVVNISNGFFSLQTSCMDSPVIYHGSSYTYPGWLYAIIDSNDLVPYGATACYKPSCSPQVFSLVMGIARDTIDTAGCDTNYIYYDPSNTYGEPFEAYIVGHKVETSNDTGWTLLPSPFCENTCNMMMKVITNYGVPPYTLTHPWASGTATFGSYNDSLGTSLGDTTIILSVPGCSETATDSSIVFVPVPVIVDACGDTVVGLIRKEVTLHPAPQPAFSYSVSSDNAVTFSDSSTNATSWQWEFGDESSSSQESPTHIYNSAGKYVVTLIVSNSICTDSISETIEVNTGIVGINGQNNSITIYPNPAGRNATVEFTSNDENVQLKLTNVLGQTLYNVPLIPVSGNSYRTNLNLSQLPAGVYEVVISSPAQSVTKEILKQE